MPLTIKSMIATIKVTAKRRESPLHKDAAPERPSLNFALPMAQPQSHSEPLPSKTATEGRGSASHKRTISAKRADPHKVAERVYELMKQETILDNSRGRS